MGKRKIWLWTVVVIGLGMVILVIFSKKTRPVLETKVERVEEKIEATEMKVAILADVHDDVEELKRILDMAKERKNELVIIAGDLTIEGKYKNLLEIKNVLDDSKIEYLVISGNHEYSKKNFGEVFGKNYQSFIKGNIKLILIDNSYWKGLGEEQKKWVENEVSECRVLICLAIMHKPLNNLFSKHVMGENNEKTTEEAAWLRQLLINSGVRQIEAGHLHYASSYELEGIRTDIVGAVSRERNNQTPRYTEIMIKGDIIEREVVTDDIGN